jgi:antagonist of KipI
MDQWSLAVANRLVGNDRGAAALEWAIAGGSLLFEQNTTIAITGAHVEATLDDTLVADNSLVAVKAGQTLTIRRLIRYRFLYVAIEGGIECPAVLGSRSTYLPAALGGIEGRRLRNGDRIVTAKNRLSARSARSTSSWQSVVPDYDATEIRVIPASTESFRELAQATYTVSAASDRMGYRLEREGGGATTGASITSEPACAGAVQIPPDGQPIVLMADSPTVGGYRIAATVITCDLPILAQCMPGRRLRFVPVPLSVAQGTLRQREKALRF